MNLMNPFPLPNTGRSDKTCALRKKQIEAQHRHSLSPLLLAAEKASPLSLLVFQWLKYRYVLSTSILSREEP